MADFRELPDLALRSIGGAVVYANDDAFAAKENLIIPGRPAFDPAAFGSQGKVYDGWETRRRRSPGHDEAIVRLGASGVVHGVVVDTAWFTGNYPPEIAVDGACSDGLVDVTTVDWEPLVPRAAVKGDTENAFPVGHPRRVTHVRLRIFPDGGVARLRVHGEAVPDLALLDALGTADLAALENGGRVVACSNAFYGSPNNLLLPGPARRRRQRLGGGGARRRGRAGAGRARHELVPAQCSRPGRAHRALRRRRDGRATAPHGPAARHPPPLPRPRDACDARPHGRLSRRRHGPPAPARRTHPERPNRPGRPLVRRFRNATFLNLEDSNVAFLNFPEDM
jgi:allantoicase